MTRCTKAGVHDGCNDRVHGKAFRVTRAIRLYGRLVLNRLRGPV